MKSARWSKTSGTRASPNCACRPTASSLAWRPTPRFDQSGAKPSTADFARACCPRGCVRRARGCLRVEQAAQCFTRYWRDNFIGNVGKLAVILLLSGVVRTLLPIWACNDIVVGIKWLKYRNRWSNSPKILKSVCPGKLITATVEDVKYLLFLLSSTTWLWWRSTPSDPSSWTLSTACTNCAPTCSPAGTAKDASQTTEPDASNAAAAAAAPSGGGTPALPALFTAKTVWWQIYSSCRWNWSVFLRYLLFPVKKKNRVFIRVPTVLK